MQINLQGSLFFRAIDLIRNICESGSGGEYGQMARQGGFGFLDQRGSDALVEVIEDSSEQLHELERQIMEDDLSEEDVQRIASSLEQQLTSLRQEELDAAGITVTRHKRVVRLLIAVQRVD